MTIAISVRRAAASDAVAITTLVNQAYEVEQFFVDGPRTDTDEIAELIDSGVFLVLEHDDGIAAAVF
ncbi:MAG: hypothetical protein NT062_38290, partial [Proteobacteria bacterium]|nr:hypothetical protein [Pseudomonadota bacterium]